MSDLDAIRERHRPSGPAEDYLPESPVCVEDLTAWPCDTARETARADAAEQDAARLAAAMERATTWSCHPTSGGTEGRWCIEHDEPWVDGRCTARVEWDEALAAHAEWTQR